MAMKVSMTGISRGRLYSSNQAGNDAAIFHAVCEGLRRLGCEVHACSEDGFVHSSFAGDVVFGMPRGRETVSCLKKLEKRGVLAVNSAFGIENCKRWRLTLLFMKKGIPSPASKIVFLRQGLALPGMPFPYWAKRGDSHAVVKEDVCFVSSEEEEREVFASFVERGISSVVVNEHLQGDLVKFYGVAGTGFFYWFYPSQCAHSKFGLETVNGKVEGISFDASALKNTCDRAASVLGVVVYGGDCIVGKDGTFRIIDFNDWPSFAPCRDEAAHYIAGYIYGQASKRFQHG